MDEDTSFDNTKRQTINPLVDEINKETEPLLKVAMKELSYELPLYVRLYNQIRFYEEYGKLKMGTSVASKETLANQFGVTIKQIDAAFDNLSNKYMLGKWIDHQKPVFRNVRRTWMSNIRLKRGITAEEKYYSVIPEVLQRNTKSITAEYLGSGVAPLSESKKKVSESKIVSKDTIGETPKKVPNPDIDHLMEYWEFTVGYAIQGKKQANRYACNNLIKKLTVAGVEQVINGVALAHGDKYAPKISDFCSLQSKLNDLILWGKNYGNNKNFIKI